MDAHRIKKAKIAHLSDDTSKNCHTSADDLCDELNEKKDIDWSTDATAKPLTLDDACRQALLKPPILYTIESRQNELNKTNAESKNGLPGSFNENIGNFGAKNSQSLIEEEDATVGVLLQYHCDCCNKDISNIMRIRCAECSDFDLCVDCFSRGAEKATHLKTHSYIPVGRNNFSLFTKDWNADEELLLLEGVSKFGFGNWNEVADLVASCSTSSKSKELCESHYLEIYLSSRDHPLPDISHILQRPSSAALTGNENWLKDEKLVKAQSKVSDIKSEFGSAAAAAVVAGIHIETPIAVPTNHSKPGVPANQKPPPTTSVIIGYMPLRGDFDVEYDNDAELILGDMEFRENEPPLEKELKLQVLQIYNAKLDERSLRKRVVIERNLLDVRRLQQLEKKRTKEEKDLQNLLKPLLRFNLETNHDRLIALLLDEKKLRSRISKLQEWRSLGLRTTRDVRTYEEAKKRRNESKLKQPDVPFVFEGAARFKSSRVSSASMLNNPVATTSPSPQSSAPSAGTSRTAQAATNSRSSRGSASTTTAHLTGASAAAAAIRAGRMLPFSVHALPGAAFCSAKELEFCEKMQLAPLFFIMAKNILLKEMTKYCGDLDKQTFTKFLKINCNKSGPIYDFVLDTNMINTDADCEATNDVANSGSPLPIS